MVRIDALSERWPCGASVVCPLRDSYCRLGIGGNGCVLEI